MTASTELTVAEQPQQLITIEPAKYVELVFEPFAKQYADAVDAVRDVAYDIKTTAGMAVAIKHRAVFRDIRVASEKARKLRKAPILEIGKLLDSRQGEIESTLLPLETLFDEEIKAEEARKEAEKAAKLAIEQARIAAIRAKIEEIKDCIVVAMGKAADEISSAIAEIESTEITLEEYFEFCGEAQSVQASTVAKLKEALSAQIEIERAAAESARQAEADRIERERVAEANRVEAKRLADLAAELERQAQAARDKQAEADRIAREQREAAEAEQRAASERAAAAMRAQQAEHEARMRAQQEEIDRQQAEINHAKAEQERAERERRAAIEAEARAKREAEEAAARAEAQRIADERAEEARRIQAERDAAETERIRRERADFLNVGPGDQEIIALVAKSYGVPYQTACNWIAKIEFVDFTDDEEKAA